MTPTIEDARNYIQEHWDRKIYLSDSSMAECVRILTEYAASLNGQGWTRVEDGLPEKYGALLATDGERVKEVFFGKVTNKTEAKFIFTAGLKTITHWMPLPNKPNL